MSQPTPSTELNKKLVKFLESVRHSSPYISNGNAYDTWFSTSLRDALHATLITTQEFDGTNDKSAKTDNTRIKYGEYKKRCASNIFDFRDIDAKRAAQNLPILGNGTLIIDKPNGANKWPDMLLVHNGVGLPIEMKSAKSSKPVWNGGLPLKGSLYIFTYNKTNKAREKSSETVFYFGEQVVSEFEVGALKAIKDITSQLNLRIQDPASTQERWQYYTRAMNNQLVNLFKEGAEAYRTGVLNEAKQKIEALTWDSQQPVQFKHKTPDTVDDSFDFIRDNFPKAFNQLRKKLNDSFARQEKLKITSDSQRAALSVVANISCNSTPSKANRAALA